MNRRHFLQFLGLGAATTAAVATGFIDPESLLWTPEKKTLFLPPTQGWMWGLKPTDLVAYEHQAQYEFLTVEMITREALAILQKNLVFARLVNREYDKSFVVEGKPIRNVLNVRTPQRYNSPGWLTSNLGLKKGDPISVPMRYVVNPARS